MLRDLKIGQKIFAVMYNKGVITAIDTVVTSIVTTERENNKIEVEYYFKDPVHNNNTSFNSYTIYTEDEFKEYLNKHFFTSNQVQSDRGQR